MTDEIKLENLPMHVLRTKVKEKGLKSKQTDKKTDLIKMLETGETTHKPVEKKKAPTLEPEKRKILAIVPDEIKADLEALAERGLKWTVNEEDCTITFTRDIKTCANLDQSARNILNTARQAFGQSRPVETGRPNGNRLEWA
jgi:thiamine pyrophosphokinase